jgi:hypothetical protein
MGQLKIKQTLITTVQYHILTVARLPTPPYFSLPTTFKILKTSCDSYLGREQSIHGNKSHTVPGTHLVTPL